MASQDTHRWIYTATATLWRRTTRTESFTSCSSFWVNTRSLRESRKTRTCPRQHRRQRNQSPRRHRRRHLPQTASSSKPLAPTQTPRGRSSPSTFKLLTASFLKDPHSSNFSLPGTVTLLSIFGRTNAASGVGTARSWPLPGRNSVDACDTSSTWPKSTANSTRRSAPARASPDSP